MKTKQDIIKHLKSEYDKWLNAIEAQELEDRDIKNLHHLTMWQLIGIIRLEAILLDEKPALPSWYPEDEPRNEDSKAIDEINKYIDHEYIKLEKSQIIKNWKESYDKFIVLAEEIPEEIYFDNNKFDFLHGYSPSDVIEGSRSHHVEHREETKQKIN